MFFYGSLMDLERLSFVVNYARDGPDPIPVTSMEWARNMTPAVLKGHTRYHVEGLLYS